MDNTLQENLDFFTSSFHLACPSKQRNQEDDDDDKSE